MAPCFTGQFCPKSSKIRSSTIWNGCIRTASVRNIYLFQTNAIFTPKRFIPTVTSAKIILKTI